MSRWLLPGGRVWHSPTMTPTPEELEAAVVVPEVLVSAAMLRRQTQDADRGEWRNPRDAQQPEPPWPGSDDPILQYLVFQALAAVKAGLDVESVMLNLAVHAWFEGGVESYDRGHRDAGHARSND